MAAPFVGRDSASEALESDRKWRTPGVPVSRCARGIAAGLLLVAGAILPAAAEQLTYTLTPDPQSGRLRVELSWRTGGRSTSVLNVVKRWGSINDISAMLRDVTFSPNARVRREGRRWIISHVPGSTITCSYEVDSGQRKLDWDGTFRPTVEAEFFHGLGTTFLLKPENGRGVPKMFDVLLRWNLPDDWPRAICSWGSGKHIGARLSASDLAHSVYYAGDIVTHTQTVQGQIVEVAMRDKFDFDVERFAEMAGKIIAEQRKFMADDEFPPFVVTAVPVGRPLGSGNSRLQGSGLYRSFAAFIAPGAELGDPVEHLFAHELFHYWNGRILDREEPEEHVYWFSEGLTDYFALRILHDSGYWDAETYVKWINRHIAEYHRNPARRASNEEIRRGFWSKRDTVGEAAYQRGLLLGLRWHYLAKKNGVFDGIDRLFHHLVMQARLSGRKLSNTRIRKAGVEQLGAWFGPEFDLYVERAEIIDLPPGALGSGFSGKSSPVYEYELGFDRERSLPQKKVRGLVSGSAAQKAGLRERDELAGWSISGKPEGKVVLQVRKNGRIRNIRYLPRGRRMMVMQFAPARGRPGAGRP